MNVLTTKETIHEAVDTFCLDREGLPELVPLGLGPIDRALGGLGPGAYGVLAAATSVGKSSTMLAAMLRSEVAVGAISVEDGPDLVGARILSALTGIDSRRIRRKDLSEQELQTLAGAARNPNHDKLFFTYPIAGHIDVVVSCIEALCARGCKLIWIDYLQEIQGTRDSRMAEIKEIMSQTHEAAAKGGAAVMMLSQFRRFGEKERDKEPQLYHLKESGDIENKARIVVLGHKVGDTVCWRLAKSTYGSEGISWEMKRDKSGTLHEVSVYDTVEEEDW